MAAFPAPNEDLRGHFDSLVRDPTDFDGCMWLRELTREPFRPTEYNFVSRDTHTRFTPTACAL